MNAQRLGFENLTNISNFHLLEVVGRGSETQLQGGENFNYLICTSTTSTVYPIIFLSSLISLHFLLGFDCSLIFVLAH